MSSRQYLDSQIIEDSTLISSYNLGVLHGIVSQRDIDAAELQQEKNRERLSSMSTATTLLDLIETWKDSYCYTADDGNEVEEAILQHARAFLGKPDIDLDECNELLHNAVEGCSDEG